MELGTLRTLRSHGYSHRPAEVVDAVEVVVVEQDLCWSYGQLLSKAPRGGCVF